jgi:hypothetical protein
MLPNSLYTTALSSHLMLQNLCSGKALLNNSQTKQLTKASHMSYNDLATKCESLLYTRCPVIPDLIPEAIHNEHR